MTNSPAAPSPYEVLGVDPTASAAELRKAYRRLLRRTHPDTGGDPARFLAVQQAWARVGDAESRRRWDSGHSASSERASRFDTASAATSSESTPRKPTPREPASGSTSGSSVRARTYGHPGGYARERFLVLMREWVGRGAEPVDVYAPSLVRSAPREIRHLLAKALAEEATVRAISGLGIGYTAWSDVATDRGKLDHVVLGPAGLFAITSEDWGSEVRLVRGELTGDGIVAGDQPVRSLARRAKALGRAARVRFTGTIIVVPDESLTESITPIGKKHASAIVRLSALPLVLRDGLGGGQRLSIEDVFDVRSRLQQSVNFV